MQNTHPTNSGICTSPALAATLLLISALLLPAMARPRLPRYANFDARNDAKAQALRGGKADATAQTALRASMAAAQAQLAARVPGLRIDANPATQNVEVVDAAFAGGALTAPAAAKRETIARGFIETNAAAFGLSAVQAQQLTVVADYANPAGNLHWVELEQRIDGIPVFQGTIRAALRKDGAIARTTGNLAPGLDYAALSPTPRLTPAQAVAAGAASLNMDVELATLTVESTSADGRSTTLAAGPFDEPTKTSLVYFAIEPGVATLAYAMTLWRPIDAFYILVDAATGELLWRKNITNDQTQTATYSVYGSDSPAPLSPSNATPGSAIQGTGVARTTFTLISEGAAFNDLGWITDGGNTTTGNNVDAGLDIDGTNGIDATGRATGSPSRVFNFAYNPGGTTGEEAPTSTNFRLGAVTNLFFWSNRFHDRLYEVGFNEAARNFQQNNFGRGGVGNDFVRAEAQDSSGTNNANFATPADGSLPRMQMFIFNQPNPDRDGDLDQEIVIHELAHGLSNRLHGNASGLNTLQSVGMGEGWSDFYARALLSTSDEDVNGVYASGGYSTQNFFGIGTDNYYYGIRRFPYAVKTNTGSNGRPHNPLTFADIDPGQTATPDGAFAKSPTFTNSALEVHNSGEIWCMALLEVRARLITRLGFAAGNQLALQLVTDGMKLDPVGPTFIQARDAIVAADVASNSGANLADIWGGFAARGMGFGASITAANVVVESFITPNLLLGNVTFSDAGGNNNGFADPGETVVLTVPLTNSTGGAATGVTATVAGGGTGNYGTINNSATSSQQINYTVPPATVAGTRLAITVTINSSLGVAGPVTPTFPLFVGQPITGFTQTFDSVTAPALPASWTTAATGGGAAWVTTTTNPNSAPNAVFTTNPATISTAELVTPSIAINSAAATLTFRNSFNFERDTFSFYDGMVFEVSVGGGAFQDVLEAGCVFLAGGFNASIEFGDNPLAGRNGWGGLSGGTTAAPAYLTTTLLLPPSMQGQSVRFKWIVGADSSVPATGLAGARIDNVAVANSATGAPLGGPPTVALPGPAITFTENAAATRLDATATVTDGDSPNFNTGNLAVDFNGAGLAEDVLGIRNEGSAAGQIGVSGNSVTFGGIAIGTFAGGGNNASLVVTFTSNNATPSAAQALVRNITYQNGSEDPTAGARTIGFTIDDGDSGVSTRVTKTVNVVAVNDAPTLAAIPNPVPVPVNAGPQTVNLSGIGAGGETQTLSASIIGNTNPTLLPSPSITYASPSATGSVNYTPAADTAGTAMLTVQVQDSGGTANGGIDIVTRSFTVIVGNAPPVVTTTGTTLNYVENQAATVIDSNLGLTDDDINLVGATVAVTANFAAGQDVLGFVDQLGITGSYSAGTGVLTLSGTAPLADYRTALRAVTYANTSDIPATAARTITFTANDGTNTGSAGRNVAVVAVNDAPVFVTGGDVVVGKNSAGYNQTWATGISAIESGQTVQFQVTANDAPALFGTPPAISPTGVLTFTPSFDAFGVANITVQLTDNGGKANGGADTSPSIDFRIAVASWEDDLGKYTGLVRPAAAAPIELGRFGLASVKFAKKGAFSMKLSLGKEKFRAKGSVDFVGASGFGKKGDDTTTTLQRKGQSPLTLDFALDTAFGSDRLAGTLTDGATAFATFTADRTLYTKKKNPDLPFVNVPNALLGKYTALFPAKTPAAQGQPVNAFPQGAGAGFLSIASSGVAKMKGTFADGTKFSHAAPLSKANEWPFHALVDKKGAIVNGPITIRTLAASDLDGANLAWVKLANANAKAYPSGWPGGILVDSTGSKFMRFAGNPLVPFLPPTDADGNAAFTFTDGGLGAPLALALNIDDKGKETVIGSAASFQLEISKKSGAIKGEFTHPATNKKTKFSGALHDRAALGGGFFLSGEESGNATLAPAP